MLQLDKERGVTYPGHSRNAMARIFPQKGAVIGNPLRSPLPVPEIGSQAPQHERESHRESTVAYVAGEIGETPIITPRCTGKIIIRCASGTHHWQCDNR